LQTTNNSTSKKLIFSADLHWTKQQHPQYTSASDKGTTSSN